MVIKYVACEIPRSGPSVNVKTYFQRRYNFYPDADLGKKGWVDVLRTEVRNALPRIPSIVVPFQHNMRERKTWFVHSGERI